MFYLAARGHKSAQAAINRTDLSPTGVAARRLYDGTSTLPPEHVVDLARMLLEPRQIPVERSTEPAQKPAAPRRRSKYAPQALPH